MKTYKSLAKKQREKIFRLFLEAEKLRFNEIEKELGIRSNEVSYHLSQMKKENIIEKNGEHYQLTKEAERYLPIFSNMDKETLTSIPVALVAIVHKNKILLIKRRKRPFKDYWCMVGGKVLLSETIEEATKRLAKEKASVEGKYDSLNAVINERIIDGKMVKHNFMLFFTKVTVPDLSFKQSLAGELKWVNLKDLVKKEIVPSDYWLIKNKLNVKEDFVRFDMKERKGRLISPKAMGI